ncbi:MAG: two-component system response regulator [Kordiimonas sp.]|mgnify:CR=1 FL=1|nr:two-component system response regulator [Kordiimonas sp.]
MAAYQLGNIKILLVDDNHYMVLLLRTILSAFGVTRMKQAANGAEAMDLLKTFQPDLIITDWRMKPVGGLELTKMVRYKDNYPLCFTPIIIVSGYSDPGSVVKARRAGINQYLVKPISPQTLYQRIIWTIENPLQFQLIDDCYVPVHNQANHPDAFPIATQGIPDDTDGDIVIEDLDDDTNTNFWL